MRRRRQRWPQSKSIYILIFVVTSFILFFFPFVTISTVLGMPTSMTTVTDLSSTYLSGVVCIPSGQFECEDVRMNKNVSFYIYKFMGDNKRNNIEFHVCVYGMNIDIYIIYYCICIFNMTDKYCWFKHQCYMQTFICRRKKKKHLLREYFDCVSRIFYLSLDYTPTNIPPSHRSILWMLSICPAEHL